jgi:AbiTii
MTLLAEIVNDATSGTPVATLLRKLTVVATRIGTPRLATWVQHELSGYPSGEPLPSYRGPFQSPVIGYFTGGFGPLMLSIQANSPQLARSPLFFLELRQSVAEIERLSQLGQVDFAWSPDALAFFNAPENRNLIRITTPTVPSPSMPYFDFTWTAVILAHVSRPVSRETFLNVVEGVRNRALELALGLEEVAPQAGQADAGPETRRQAQLLVNNYFFNASSNVAISSSDFEQRFGY